MTQNSAKQWISGLAVGLMSVGAAEAAPITYFGQDAGANADGGAQIATHPVSDAARNLFLSTLSSFTTQTLEGIGNNTPTPIIIPGFATITAAVPGNVVTVVGSDNQGGFPISGTQLFQKDGGGFTVTLENAVTAFGFYGIDVGDVGGQLSLTEFGNVPHTVANQGNSGGVFFYGVTDTTPFSVITFNNSSGVDRFNFDDFTIGTVNEDLAAVPEPATLLLLGTSLAGMAGAAWKRRKAARLAD